RTPIHHRIDRLPRPRAGESASRDATGPRRTHLRPPSPSPDRAPPLVQGPPPAPTRRAGPAPYGGRATVKAMLDDLTTLPAKRREKRLEKPADEALPCRAITVFDGTSNDGVTVALHVDSLRRGDVLDLARVVEDDTRVHGTCDWSLLPPAG